MFFCSSIAAMAPSKSWHSVGYTLAKLIVERSPPSCVQPSYPYFASSRPEKARYSKARPISCTGKFYNSLNYCVFPQWSSILRQESHSGGCCVTTKWVWTSPLRFWKGNAGRLWREVRITCSVNVANYLDYHLLYPRPLYRTRLPLSVIRLVWFSVIIENVLLVYIKTQDFLYACVVVVDGSGACDSSWV